MVTRQLPQLQTSHLCITISKGEKQGESREVRKRALLILLPSSSERSPTRKSTEQFALARRGEHGHISSKRVLKMEARQKALGVAIGQAPMAATTINALSLGDDGAPA
jgi:hypothetical protein